jgi:5-methylcytosine-specific restriction protein A
MSTGRKPLKLPELDPLDYKRYFDKYSVDVRAKIVCAWLIDGLTHRQIDRDILNLNQNSKGFQSHGVLKHLGLGAGSRGFFNGMELSDVIVQLRQSAPHREVANTLEALRSPYRVSARNGPTPSLSEIYEDEYTSVCKSLKLFSFDRLTRIKNKSAQPEKILITTSVFRRNPDIVAEALIRADGMCEHCGSKAPFVRASDGTPYLEVHHVTPMSAGGLDTLENVKALCPNCHRRMHFG